MGDLDDLGPPPADRRPDGPRAVALTAGVCRLLLDGAPVARLAFTVDGRPVVMPVNDELDGEDSVISRLDRVRSFHSWDGRKTHWIRIRPLQLTGRRLPTAWRYLDPPNETNDE